MIRFLFDTLHPYIWRFLMMNEDDTETRDYTVQGMTCAHCVASVREEVSDVAGVNAVDVDLASGHMTVTGTGFNHDAVRAAVAEAGYDVAA
jgi:copper chaperone CopZ